MERTFLALTLAIISLFSLNTHAASGRADYDLDDDGLIEINDWADLDEIRNNLEGKALYGISSGCPVAGCIGFELTTDLDFDTNGDGALNGSDAYWNGGGGWEAIGKTSEVGFLAGGGTPFNAIFDGNGHVIKNLMIDRTATFGQTGSVQGLFGYAYNATLRNLGLSGKWMSIRGATNVGGLVGGAINVSISGCYSTGTISKTTESYGAAGGLVGDAEFSSITNSFSTGSISSNSFAGGLLGYTFYGSDLNTVFSTANVFSSDGSAGGLAGYKGNFNVAYATGKVTAKISQSGLGNVGEFTGSYWATNTTAQAHGSVGGSGGTGVTLAQLQCPTGADNTSCVQGVTLYQGWADLKDAIGNPYWDFGTVIQLPGLVMNGVVYRDSDGDSYLDSDDAFPINYEASRDSDADGLPDSWNTNCDTNCQTSSSLTLDALIDIDGDGSPDSWNVGCDATCQIESGLKLDAYPNNTAASVDTDRDGSPDSWNAGCNSACQANSGLKLDAFPNYAAASVDTDGDGFPDRWNASCDATCQTNSGLRLDAIPDQAAASIDTDGDGFPDSWNASCDPTCQIMSGLTLDALPNNRAASIDSDSDGSPDSWNTGCDATCQANSGLKLDAWPSKFAAYLDTDGDGYPDSWNAGCDSTCQANSGLRLDAIPNYAAASIDNDGDGSPDSWNAGCDSTCQINSGLKLDAFPNNAAASIDTDGDSFPDSWNTTCDATCQTKSGLKLDAFPTNATASIDTDGDGFPNSWNTTCDKTCQANSGLSLDKLVNDRDNDGVADIYDTDNGKPTILVVPSDIKLAATGATTAVTFAFADIKAFDDVDSAPTLGVFFKGQRLTPNASNQVLLPSGALKLQWVAIDHTGNMSDPVEQAINIYPQVQFTKTTQLTGEPNNAKLYVTFSGESPEYPIQINFTLLNGESTGTSADLDTTAENGIDTTNLFLKINNATELANASLNIPVIQDNIFEGKETLTFELTSATADIDHPFQLPILGANKKTTLTINEENVAPTLAMSIKQAGKETTLIDPKGGIVSVNATVTDPNISDSHSFVWETQGLPANGSNQATYEFDPSGMMDGAYALSVTTTDSGEPPLSTSKVTLNFNVVAPVIVGSSSSSSSSGSAPVAKKKKGGSMDYLTLLMIVTCSAGGLVARTRR